MRKYTIVVLNKYPEYAANLIASIRRTHKKLPDIFVVRDNHEHDFGPDISSHTQTLPFVAARNINMGFIANPYRDIIFCNDDMECVQDEFFDRLHRFSSLSIFSREIGVMSPLIDGGVGNQLQQWPAIEIWGTLPNFVFVESTVCFPCVWINRKMIDQIGLMDEDMVNYGFDDDTYCLKARNAGWRTAITQTLRIKHGSGGAVLDRGKNWSCSFAREGNVKSNLEVFTKKYS